MGIAFVFCELFQFLFLLWKVNVLCKILVHKNGCFSVVSVWCDVSASFLFSFLIFPFMSMI